MNIGKGFQLLYILTVITGISLSTSKVVGITLDFAETQTQIYYYDDIATSIIAIIGL
jgi:hypothetical protein